MTECILQHVREPAMLVGDSRIVEEADGVRVEDAGSIDENEWLDVTTLLLGSNLVTVPRLRPGRHPLADAAPLDAQYSFYAEPGRLLALHQKIPAFPEPAIVRYGREYIVEDDGTLRIAEPAIIVERETMRVRLSLRLLLSAGLTTPEAIVAVAGPWRFAKRGNVDDFL